MAAFKNTNTKIFTKLEPELSPEAIYWKRFGAPALLKEFGPIDYIDFSPQEPYHFAVTCSVRVQVYNPVTKSVYKNLNRFRETAYGGKFRHDGKLLCAGGDEAQVKLFDVGSKNLLRVFSGHKAAVHRCFFTTDGTHILSCSDDKTVALWDLPSETSVSQYQDFADYVRAGAVSPVSADLALVGSYDKKVTLLDCRTNVPVLSVEHGSPVESVIFNPNGGLFISAGGTEVCIWDALAGGRLLARLTPHHKTVTCLALAAGGTRLLSGGLDRRVRVTDLGAMQTLHGLDFPSPILSLGISALDEVLAVGMVDGLVSVLRREEQEPRIPKPSRISRPFGLRLPPDPVEASDASLQADMVVPELDKTRISNTDRYLRSFRYSRALDVALVPYNQKRRPDIIVALFQELLRRKGVESALAGRDESSLLNILKFISKYIGEFEYTPTLVDVTNIFLEVYEDKLEKLPEVAALCKTLLRQLAEEEKVTQSLLELQGALQMLGAAGSYAEPADRPVELEPSQSVSGNVLEVSLT